MKKSLVILGIVYVMGVTLLSAKEVVSETPLGYKGINCNSSFLVWIPEGVDPWMPELWLLDYFIKRSKYLKENITKVIGSD